MIEKVSDIFKVLTNVEYPHHNKMVFEEYFMNHFQVWSKPGITYTYLPIMWTNFYISRKYGTADMSDLQEFLDGLDKSKHYFTVIQYDDGILQNIENLDILIFGAGGGGVKTRSERNLGMPIPLICSPTPNLNKSKNRDILCSFVGTIGKGYVIRQKLLKLSSPFLIKGRVGYDSFVDIMERSIFSLCPRGYGATSFRICEALQHGSIPVYVYDKPWIPWEDEFDFNDIGILIHESEISNILKLIQSKTKEDIKKYLRNGESVYEEYFSFRGCAQTIINRINE